MISFMDKRSYFWIPRSEVAFFQSLVDSTDNIARIRTEQNTETEAKIILIYDSSLEAEVRDLVRYYEQESGNIAKTV